MRKLLGFGFLLALGGAAHAHVYLMTPTPRNPLSLKEGPCGVAGSVRSTTITTYRPGQTVKVIFRDEFAHTGHYRISFDADGVDDFKDPVAENDFDNSASVLKDAIIDMAGNTTYEVDVTLPNVECTNCTLQIIQVMTEAVGFDPTRDIYYQCADLVLKADAPVPVVPDAGMPAPAEADAAPEPVVTPPPSTTEPKADDDYEVGEVSACAVGLGGGGGVAGLAVLLVGLALLVVARRR